MLVLKQFIHIVDDTSTVMKQRTMFNNVNVQNNAARRSWRNTRIKQESTMPSRTNIHWQALQAERKLVVVVAAAHDFVIENFVGVAWG